MNAETKTRIKTSVVFGSVVFLALWIGGWCFTALLIGVGFFLMQELSLLVSSERDGIVLGGGGGALAGACLLAQSGALPMAFFILLAGGLGLFLVQRPILCAVGVVYMGGPLVLMTALRHGDSGLLKLFIFLMVVFGTDIFAYFLGRHLGGKKLWPRVSPGKTWSGAFGGVLGGVICGGLVAVLFAPSLFWDSGFFGFFASLIGISLAGQGGDLLESGVKRVFHVKDSGCLLPGHGGLLDRLDSVLGAGWFLGVLSLFPGSFWNSAVG